MISVCIATHNGEKYIKEQIDSILCQISDDDEIVISDDGSTDRTIDVINEYRDRRIKLYKYKHLRKYGYTMDYSTHNFENAILHSSGEYIFLADQDDVWLPNKVKFLMAALENCDIAVHAKKITDSDLNIVDEYEGSRLGLFYNILFPGITGCCMAFKKKVLKRIIPFPNTGVCHDFWIGAYGGIFYKVKLVKEPLILYRRHSNNVTPSGGKSGLSFFKKVEYRWLMIKAIINGLFKRV